MIALAGRALSVFLLFVASMCGPPPPPPCCAILLFDVSRMGTVGDWVIDPNQGQPLVTPDEWWLACRYSLSVKKALSPMGNTSTLLVTLVHAPGKFSGEWHLRPESRIDYITYGWAAVKAFGVYLYN